MNYRKMGKHGLKLSEVSLGSWVTFGGQVGEDVALECMRVAYDAGINFFDGAEGYAHGQAEVVMGNVLKREKWRREGLVLSTKIFFGGKGPNDTGLSHKHIIEGVHGALRRWQQDYLDLAFCHRPDPDTPIEETVRAFDILVRQGKVFYWGTSEWSAAQVLEAHDFAVKHGLTPPSMEQPQYNLLVRGRFENEYAPLYEKLGYGTTIWSPLASGILTGKYAGGKIPAGSRLAMEQNAWLKDLVATPEKIASAGRLEPLANELGCTIAQLAIAWCLKKPHVSTVILGASRAQQLKENLQALDVAAKLDDAWVKKLENAIAGKK
jgi:voltage-dependent potassium channel beta subunit